MPCIQFMAEERLRIILPLLQRRKFRKLPFFKDFNAQLRLLIIINRPTFITNTLSYWSIHFLGYKGIPQSSNDRKMGKNVTLLYWTALGWIGLDWIKLGGIWLDGIPMMMILMSSNVFNLGWTGPASTAKDSFIPFDIAIIIIIIPIIIVTFTNILGYWTVICRNLVTLTMEIYPVVARKVPARYHTGGQPPTE